MSDKNKFAKALERLNDKRKGGNADSKAAAETPDKLMEESDTTIDTLNIEDTKPFTANEEDQVDRKKSGDASEMAESATSERGIKKPSNKVIVGVVLIAAIVMASKHFVGSSSTPVESGVLGGAENYTAPKEVDPLFSDLPSQDEQTMPSQDLGIDGIDLNENVDTNSAEGADLALEDTFLNLDEPIEQSATVDLVSSKDSLQIDVPEIIDLKVDTDAEIDQPTVDEPNAIQSGDAANKESPEVAAIQDQSVVVPQVAENNVNLAKAEVTKEPPSEMSPPLEKAEQETAVTTNNDELKQLIETLVQQNSELNKQVASLAGSLKSIKTEVKTLKSEKPSLIVRPNISDLMIVPAARNCEDCVAHAFFDIDGKTYQVGHGDTFMGYMVKIAGDRLNLMKTNSDGISFWVN